MASITGTYQYADGETISIDVVIENDYPDAMAEAKATVVAAIRELTGLTVEAEVDPDK